MNLLDNPSLIKILSICAVSILLSISFVCIRWPSRTLRKNAFGKQIPVIYGVVPATCLSIVFFLLFPTNGFCCITTMGFCIVGLCDDLYGSGDYRGIGGHLRAFANRKLTTGFLKLIASPLLAIVFAMSNNVTLSWLTCLHTVTIAASSNVFNLLDLRPGRSQGFAIITLLIFLMIYQSPLIICAILVLLTTIWVDSRAKAMMGDSGAITIGASVGMIAIASSNIGLIITFTVFAISINLMAEKYSLGKLIANNVFLRSIDSCLGQRSES